MHLLCPICRPQQSDVSSAARHHRLHAAEHAADKPKLSLVISERRSQSVSLVLENLLCEVISFHVFLKTHFILWQAEQLEKIFERLGRRVRGFYGSRGGGSIPPDTAIAVCTIEKANILVRLTARLLVVVPGCLCPLPRRAMAYSLSAFVSRPVSAPRCASVQCVSYTFSTSSARYSLHVPHRIPRSSHPMHSRLAVQDFKTLYRRQGEEGLLSRRARVGSVSGKSPGKQCPKTAFCR